MYYLSACNRDLFKSYYYFLIPSSNESNLIYLQSSEWGKHDKKQQISSSGVMLSFVFQQGSRFFCFYII